MFDESYVRSRLPCVSWMRIFLVMRGCRLADWRSVPRVARRYRAAQGADERAVVGAAAAWSFGAMYGYAMRIAAPSFMLAVAFAFLRFDGDHARLGMSEAEGPQRTRSAPRTALWGQEPSRPRAPHRP